MRGILVAAEHLAPDGREFGVLHRSQYALILLLAAAGIWRLATPVAAATMAEERAKLRTAESSTKKASHLYALKKYPEAGDAAREAQDALGELEKSETKALAQPLAAVRKSLIKVHDQLKGEKIELPDLPPALLSAKAGKKQAAVDDKISFTRQVAPSCRAAAAIATCSIRAAIFRWLRTRNYSKGVRTASSYSRATVREAGSTK